MKITLAWLHKPIDEQLVELQFQYGTGYDAGTEAFRIMSNGQLMGLAQMSPETPQEQQDFANDVFRARQVHNVLVDGDEMTVQHLCSLSHD